MTEPMMGCTSMTSPILPDCGYPRNNYDLEHEAEMRLPFAHIKDPEERERITEAYMEGYATGYEDGY